MDIISTNPELFFSMITAATAIIAICISVVTVRQNHKIFKETNRPYITIYFNYIQVSGSSSYLIIKNFGNTGAVIDNITYDENIVLVKQLPHFKPFIHLKNTFIAPGQSISSFCEFSEDEDPITFKINYHNGKDKYEETFHINPKMFKSNLTAKSSSPEATNQILQSSFEELLRHLL